MKKWFDLRFTATLLVTALGLAFFYGQPGLAQEVTETPAATEVVTESATEVATEVVTMEGTRANDGNGYVRFVQASPDASSVTIALNDQPNASHFQFGDISDFVEVPANIYTVSINTSESSNASLSKDIVLAPEVSTTLVLMGLLNGSDKTALQLGIFLTERAPTTGKARLEVINAVPDAPSLDLLSSDQPVLTEIAFGKSGAAPLNLEPGSYDLHLVPSGQTEPPILDLTGTELQADTIYTLIVTGQQSDQSVKSILLTTTPPNVDETPTPAPDAVTPEITLGS